MFVEKGGLKEVEMGYVKRRYINRADGGVRRRVWVHARFEKPRKEEEEEAN